VLDADNLLLADGNRYQSVNHHGHTTNTCHTIFELKVIVPNNRKAWINYVTLLAAVYLNIIVLHLQSDLFPFHQYLLPVTEFPYPINASAPFESEGQQQKLKC
jgi:hypothetical protein